MAIEIERRFLVRDHRWRQSAGPGRRISQGYVARHGGGVVRVRRAGEQAFLAVKGARAGICRAEYEYEIPLADGEAMLRDLCPHPPLQKVRYEVPYGGLVWEVDVFLGAHSGLVLAEVELNDPDQSVSLPPWIGPEVTYEARYRSAALIAQPGPSAAAALRSV